MNSFTLFLAQTMWEDKVFEALIPNIWVFLAHILASIILLIFIIYFAWKPTKDFMRRKKEAISKDIEEAKQNRMESEKELKETKEFVQKANEEYIAMKKNAEVESEEIKQQIVGSAQSDAQLIIERANEEITKKEKAMRLSIDQEISDAAIIVAEELIKTKIDKNTNSKLIDSLIEDIKKN